jgi:hypothetical protein
VDQDLHDLLALWLGDHDPGEARRQALLARLDSDTAFRGTFIEEIRLLGMLRAVQSSEPRWLRLEDEAGWSARRCVDVDTLAQRVVQQDQRRRRTRRTVRWLLAAAAAVLLTTCLYLATRPRPVADPGSPAPSAARAEVAVVVTADALQWLAGSQTPRAGEVVMSGRLRLREGQLTLAFFGGASLTVEGPADLELLTADRVFCHQGRLRARVPRGAEGFTVLAPGYEIVDLGTEFGLNFDPGGRARVMVFEGAASVSVLNKEGRSVRGALLEGRRAVEIDPNGAGIQEVPAQPETFIPLGQFAPAPLELEAAYAAEILAANPWGYWRFESLQGDKVTNEVAGRPALQLLGGVELQRSPGGNGWAHFNSGHLGQALLMDGEWTPSRAGGYAIELWVQAESPSPAALSPPTFGQGTALVGLIARDDDQTEKHLAYLELAGRSRRSPHEPCAVRFLDRWPAGVSHGANVFSRRNIVTSLWHHVVGQKSGDTLELYVDGEQVGTSPTKLNAQDPDGVATTACRLLVGRLKQRSQPPCTNEIRAFEGRLDELAVYDRALAPEEIRRHARLRQ